MDGSGNTILSEANFIHKKTKTVCFISFVDINFILSDMHVPFGIFVFRELVRGYEWAFKGGGRT